MKIKEIIDTLEQFSPLSLQDGFDNAGLQVGLTEAETTGILLCLDVTEAILDEAVTLGCNLIISHHPLIFKGYKSITGKNYAERCIIKAIKNDIAVYSAHTNLDNTIGGVNGKIAEIIGLQDVRILAPKEDLLLKLATYVPADQADRVREALFAAGCGHIGNYDLCSYNTAGEGTYRAGKQTHPFRGTEGRLHCEKEVKIETVLPAYLENAALKALLSAHPYEEPAYDIYPLRNAWPQVGAGIIGDLHEPEKEEDFLIRIKGLFGVKHLKYNRSEGRSVQRIAVCGGSGAFLIDQAIRRGADAFLTGEIKYHEYFGHEQEILMVEIGHYESEQYTKHVFYGIIAAKYPQAKIHISEINTNPIKYL